MHQTLNISFRKLSFAGLLVLAITAIFSTGYNNFDEHFQILEFSNYKMGYSPASQLAWEYHQQLRPAAQPFIAYCVSKTLESAGIYNPFTVALLLRLLTAMLTWVVIGRVIKCLLPQFRTDNGKKIFVWCSYFLWFVPYIGVRFGAENVSGALFFLALTYLPGISLSKPHSLRLFLAGILLGFSLFLRLQMGFAFIGLAIWMLFIQKYKWQHYILLIAGGIAAIGICIVIDYWFYGNWYFTPYNYFNVNLLQNKASEFGVDPFWKYIGYFIETAVPPLSIALLLLFIKGIIKKPLHPFSWVVITFVLGHSLIGHKEMRFLFPMVYALIFLACTGYESLNEKLLNKKAIRISFIILVILNTGTLLYRMFSPAENRIAYYQYIYNYAQQGPTVFIALKESPYNVVTLETNFYKPRNTPVYIVQTASELAQIRDTLSAGTRALFMSPNLVLPEEFSSTRMKRVFAPYPEWVLNIEFNNWQQQSNVKAIYELE